jgi:hypothetical protein
MKVKDLLERSGEGDVSKTITLTGKPECVERTLALLSMLHLNSGHSGYFAISWDGDGADYLRVSGKDYDSKKYKDLVNALSSWGGAVEVVGENNVGFCLDAKLDTEQNYARLASKSVYPKTDK